MCFKSKAKISMYFNLELTCLLDFFFLITSESVNSEIIVPRKVSHLIGILSVAIRDMRDFSTNVRSVGKCYLWSVIKKYKYNSQMHVYIKQLHKMTNNRVVGPFGKHPNIDKLDIKGKLCYIFCTFCKHLTFFEASKLKLRNEAFLFNLYLKDKPRWIKLSLFWWPLLCYLNPV